MQSNSEFRLNNLSKAGNLNDMPHCVLEISSNVEDQPDFRELFEKLHSFIVANSDVVLATLKSRMLRYDNFYIGSGDPESSFIYLNISMMSGRTEEVRVSLSRGALEILTKYFPKACASGKCSINVGIQELNKKTYSKETRRLS